MPKIQLEKLTKRYGSEEVLRGIDLSMEENEFTILVGPSGCGKSTTLRMLAGLESVSEGEIYMDDRPISHLEPKDRDISMVFQDYALYPHMNVARNMSFALRLQKRPKAEIDAKVSQVAEMLGLSDYLHRKTSELSGGQRQRVAMGRALTKDSATFLFDEPLSNLDASLRGQMRAELALMRRQVRKNMVYVTHDQIEAMTLADRIVVMLDGSVQQQGSPEELFKRPINTFVAGFIGSPPMNFIPVVVNEKEGNLYAESTGVSVRLDERLSERVRSNTIDELVMGIRPSDFMFDSNAPEGRRIDAQVSVSEYVGAQSVLICHCGDQRITAEVNSETPIALGENLRFAVRVEGIHLFDKQTDQAL